MPRFGAVVTAMVTPFADDGALDLDAAVRLARWLTDHGSDGLVVAGTTGEGPVLSDAEKLDLWRAVAEAVTVPVVGGTGSNDTAHSVELTERAHEAGVDAMLVVTPYYVRPNRRGIKAHYEAVAAATDKPVILYNIPARTATDMPNDLLAELAQIENVTAVKQANNDNLAPVEGLEIYAGNDDIFARTLDMGGAGVISVASHIVGDEMRRMVDEPENRAELDELLQDVVRTLFVTSNPIPLKAALNLLGHGVGGHRLPMVEADEEETETVRAMLERHGLLEPARS